MQSAGWPGQTVPFAIYTKFQKHPPRPVTEVMEKEVEAIISPLGLPIEWRPLDGSQVYGDTAELVIVTFRGDCDADSQARTVGQPSPLGWTHLSDGQILPFAEVDCDRIRGVIR